MSEQLVKFVKGEEKHNVSYELNEVLLSSLLNECAGYHVCPIFICGPVGEGKSFLLSYMLEHMESKKVGHACGSDISETTSGGFLYQKSSNAVTDGIWVSKTPILVKNAVGITVAVIFFDTKGFYSEATSESETIFTLGLSMLLSSTLLYNCSKVFNEDSFQTFEYFRTFTPKGMPQQFKMRPFQNLKFVIRDWNNSHEYCCGSEGGNKFIGMKLSIKDNQSRSATNIRKFLKARFENISCFLFPHIDTDAESMKLNCFNRKSISFEQALNLFVDDFASTEFNERRVFGIPLSGGLLKVLLSSYISVFNEDNTPAFDCIWEDCLKDTQRHCQHEVVMLYRKLFAKTESIDKYLNRLCLEEAHITTKAEVCKYISRLGQCITDEWSIDEIIEHEFKTVSERFDTLRTNAVNMAENELEEEMKHFIESYNPNTTDPPVLIDDDIKDLEACLKMNAVAKVKSKLDWMPSNEKGDIISKYEMAIKKYLKIVEDENNIKLHNLLESIRIQEKTLIEGFENSIRKLANFQLLNEDEFKDQIDVLTNKVLEKRSKIAFPSFYKSDWFKEQVDDISHGATDQYGEMILNGLSILEQDMEKELEIYRKIIKFAKHACPNNDRNAQMWEAEHENEVHEITDRLLRSSCLPTSCRLFEMKLGMFKKTLEDIFLHYGENTLECSPSQENEHTKNIYRCDQERSMEMAAVPNNLFTQECVSFSGIPNNVDVVEKELRIKGLENTLNDNEKSAFNNFSQSDKKTVPLPTTNVIATQNDSSACENSHLSETVYSSTEASERNLDNNRYSKDQGFGNELIGNSMEDMLNHCTECEIDVCGRLNGDMADDDNTFSPGADNGIPKIFAACKCESLLGLEPVVSSTEGSGGNTDIILHTTDESMHESLAGHSMSEGLRRRIDSQIKDPGNFIDDGANEKAASCSIENVIAIPIDCSESESSTGTSMGEFVSDGIDGKIDQTNEDISDKRNVPAQVSNFDSSEVSNKIESSEGEYYILTESVDSNTLERNLNIKIVKHNERFDNNLADNSDKALNSGIQNEVADLDPEVADITITKKIGISNCKDSLLLESGVSNTEGSERKLDSKKRMIDESCDNMFTRNSIHKGLNDGSNSEIDQSGNLNGDSDEKKNVSSKVADIITNKTYSSACENFHRLATFDSRLTSKPLEECSGGDSESEIDHSSQVSLQFSNLTTIKACSFPCDRSISLKLEESELSNIFNSDDLADSLPKTHVSTIPDIGSRHYKNNCSYQKTLIDRMPSSNSVGTQTLMTHRGLPLTTDFVTHAYEENEIFKANFNENGCSMLLEVKQPALSTLTPYSADEAVQGHRNPLPNWEGDSPNLTRKCLSRAIPEKNFVKGKHMASYIVSTSSSSIS